MAGELEKPEPPNMENLSELTNKEWEAKQQEFISYRKQVTRYEAVQKQSQQNASARQEEKAERRKEVDAKLAAGKSEYSHLSQDEWNQVENNFLNDIRRRRR